MNGPEILSIYCEQLADFISLGVAPPALNPLPVSPWIAMSLMQKAIRRGREDLALRAAATLLQVAPDRLWRRLGCIAFEDIGVADIEVVSLTTAALAGKRFRAQLGGEWRVASSMVSRMVQAPKCRAADDLLMCAELHPSYRQARSALPHETTPELLRITTGSEPLPIRALALWFALGTDRRPSRQLQARRGEPASVFDQLCEAGYPHTIVEIAREGFRRTGEVLCPFVALLALMRLDQPATIASDHLPPEIIIDSVPSWASDVYSREGRAGLEGFLQGSSQTARWVQAHIPASQRVSFLGGIVFRVEGGLVQKRLRWSVGDELRHRVDVECQGLHCPNASHVLDLMRADLFLLNRVRAHVR
jgi:hypothetical protein